MSEATRDTLEAALNAHFADEFGGATLTSYVVQGYGEKFETGGGFYLGLWPQGQPLHITGGLLDYGVQRHAARMLDTITDPDNDDDD